MATDLPASSETVKYVGAAQHSKYTGRRDDRHGGLLFPPERGEHGLAFRLRKEKSLILTPNVIVRHLRADQSLPKKA